MTIEFDGLAGLTEQALNHLEARIRLFADDVVREASRIEEGDRLETLEVPEITATHIDEAYRGVRRPKVLANPPAPPSKARKAAQAASAVSGVAWGSMLTAMNSEWQVGICVALGMIFIFATIWLIWGKHE